ncbi:DUF4249 family protein [Pedobacter metabolipauper]|uniref:DUF4249 domain-containing protein n=1 Tax=Pedobacter metabolipauper TaxID=425513 RepID=A0A4R6SVY5_9SPHI|nr:hypothetical protein [Pedobacter metabolipauper]TDQ09243.1 hypothetical protein ATK78_1397 [Pedobacter metabolipauper]
MKRFSIYCFTLVLLLAGCSKNPLEEDLFVKPVRTYDMAVEGGFNTYSLFQYIRLTKPALFPDSAPTPIRKATVTISDGKTAIVLREGQPGIYIGINGRTDPSYNSPYTLTIKYNDKTYTAVDTLRQVVNIIDDFLPLSTRTVNNQVIGTIPKHTFGYLNANKWYFSYSNIPAWTPGRFDITENYSYTHLLGSPNSLYPLSNLKRTFTLAPNDFISIYKISLSEGYSRYLYSVFMETDWSGLFSGVPVNVQGNFSGGNVQGYFSAVDVDNRTYSAKEL